MTRGKKGAADRQEQGLKQDVLIPQEGKGARGMLQGTGETRVQIASQGQTSGVGLYSHQRCVQYASSTREHGLTAQDYFIYR